MTDRVAACLSGLLLFVTAGFATADDLQIPADQLANLGVEFGMPQVVGLADDFHAPARVRVPAASDFAVVPIFSGAIKKLGVSAGDEVRKGQAIAWIASPEFLELQSKYIDALHRLELGQTRYNNEKTLNEEGIVSTRRLSESKHELEEHRLAEQGLRQFLELAGLARVEIDQLHDTLRLQPELILRAPVNGVVLEAYRTVGQQIDASQPVYRIGDLSTLWLEIDVPFTRSVEIVRGATIVVRQARRNITGTVTTIGRHVDEDNQTVVVRAVIENDSSLAPGQFVTATMTQGKTGEYLSLPAASVVRKDDQDYVFVRKPDGVNIRKIAVIRRAQGQVIIDTDIGVEDEIVTSGTAALKARWLGMGGGD